MNRFQRLSLCLLAPFFAVMIVSGCKSSETELRIVGEPSMRNATRVRIYQLTSPSNFETARFEDLFRNDDAVLGSELLRKEQIQVFPDQARTILLEPDKNAQYVGFAADLREPEGDAWRSIHEIRDVKGKQMTVIVGSGNLLVEVR